jgi:hypothetical protein
MPFMKAVTGAGLTMDAGGGVTVIVGVEVGVLITGADGRLHAESSRQMEITILDNDVFIALL